MLCLYLFRCIFQTGCRQWQLSDWLINPLQNQRSASEPTAAIKSRIDAARQFASQRLNIKDAPLNVTMTAAEIKAEIGSNPEITDLLNNEMKSQKLSARGLHKAVRVARTIADLNASPVISRLHMLEALSYRRFLTGRLHSG